MLREGWAPEEKRPRYYGYIFEESERLSRLIANVLQLARLNRNHLSLELQTQEAAALLQQIRSKVAAQVEGAGFALHAACEEPAARAQIRVDADALIQILINLVDNALKFAAKARPRRVEIHCRLQPGGRLVFAVRDYGPGIPRQQLKKIFRLFYRLENELTRGGVPCRFSGARKPS